MLGPCSYMKHGWTMLGPCSYMKHGWTMIGPCSYMKHGCTMLGPCSYMKHGWTMIGPCSYMKHGWTMLGSCMYVQKWNMAEPWMYGYAYWSMNDFMLRTRLNHASFRYYHLFIHGLFYLYLVLKHSFWPIIKPFFQFLVTRTSKIIMITMHHVRIHGRQLLLNI